MQIKNTSDYPKNTSLMMMVYGMGGVGKTTFAATFPKPLLLDFENGAKYFGERGIDVDVANFQDWFNAEDFSQLKEVLPKYQTIIVDPIGEAMEKLINSTAINGAKYRQASGDLTMAGWGEVKRRMRTFIKWLRDTGKNVVIVAHVDEKNDDGIIIRRPMIATKLSDELITMVDVVAYMRTVQVAEGDQTVTKRVLMLDPSDEKTVSKDRTGKLGKIIKPDYDYIAEHLGYKLENDTQEADSAKDDKKPAKGKKTSKKAKTEATAKPVEEDATPDSAGELENGE